MTCGETSHPSIMSESSPGDAGPGGRHRREHDSDSEGRGGRNHHAVFGSGDSETRRANFKLAIVLVRVTSHESTTDPAARTACKSSESAPAPSLEAGTESSPSPARQIICRGTILPRLF